MPAAYDLLARLHRDGPTAALRRELAGLPVLGEALAAVPEATRLAVERERVYGFNVYPLAGAFLHPEGQAGGALAERAARLLGPADDGRSDHLAHALGALGHGLAAGAPVAWQRAALDGYLLAWLPLWVRAVVDLDAPFFGALAELTLELALAHRQALGPADPDVLYRLPPAEDPLADPDTDLDRLAAALCRPLTCGAFLTRDRLARLGRRSGPAVGIGPRSRMMATLLHGAAEQRRLSETLAGIAELLEVWRAGHEALAMGGVPGAEALGRCWGDRAEAGLTLIDRVRRAATD